ncbi:sulfurtransferase FdhD [Saccharospirillum salsuginis]|uniref:Sulfur carrier protein FdhD n=1 Tax=Saccharospirillum salsuginis TaxID=418750 RepID=A0A918NCE4_9GAMM|nr:formate dehydrogenase accessory sulfurtransferase FdhD [Saccharospirillum salsuginis]GGX57397.1 sulfurtransferase FdhD [Saccharospirillum salsuginis]
MAIKALNETGRTGYRIQKVTVRRRTKATSVKPPLPLGEGWGEGDQQTPSQTNWQETTNDDTLAEELPIALTYNNQTHAIMMVTPTDLEDFALGFTLTEGIIQHPKELYDLNITDHGDQGIELNLHIHGARQAALKQQHRNMAGPTGCGLCGKASLDQVMRPLPKVTPRPQPSADAIQTALNQLKQYQPLQQMTGAIHAAAWCDEQGKIQLVREDVGRHNALDKLIGGLHSQGVNTDAGFLLLSSRASFELIAKAAQCDLGALVTVSGASSMAVQQAKHYGVRLTGFARNGRQVAYC